MKIIGIEIVNDRAVKTFKVNLDGKNLTVSGDTGSGKTTSISGLWELIKQAADAITHGEDKGWHRLTLSDGVSTINAIREYKKGKPSEIRITDDKANKIPIAVFKTWLSELAVNPHKIADMKPTEQVNTLLAAADLGDFDLGDVDHQIGQWEDERLALFQAVKVLEPGEEPEAVKSVDVAALIKKSRAADASNIAREAVAGELERIKELGLANKDGIERHRAEAARLTAEAERLEKLNNGLREQGEAASKKLHETAVIDTAPIATALADAQETNAKANAHEQWTEREKRHAEKQKDHKAAEAKVKGLREHKKKALAGAKFPLKGITIGDAGVEYNGALLANLGTSEQILVCCAIAKKDILAHKVHVARIDGIESMSAKDTEKLHKLFHNADPKKDIQVLATRVSRGDIEPHEIVITDGEYTEE